jgi:hypothetical protein
VPLPKSPSEDGDLGEGIPYYHTTRKIILDTARGLHVLPYDQFLPRDTLHAKFSQDQTESAEPPV